MNPDLELMYLPEANQIIAMSTIRIIAGVLFFFQGYDKVFKVGITEVSQTMHVSLGNNKLPISFIRLIATFSSWAELLCGFLLIIGFFKFFALYVLCLNLVIISIGFSMAKPMWENAHVFFRLILILLLLLLPSQWDKFSFDYIFALSKLNV